MSVLGSAQVEIRFVAGLSPSCANLADPPKLKQSPSCLLTPISLPRKYGARSLPTCGSLSQDCRW